MEASGQKPNTEAALAVDAALAQLEETVGDREFVAELIHDFLAELPAQLAELRAASWRDAERLHRIAHTLKSNAATFGAERLANACRGSSNPVAPASGRCGSWLRASRRRPRAQHPDWQLRVMRGRGERRSG